MIKNKVLVLFVASSLALMSMASAKSMKPNIVGGVDAEKLEFPFQVSIQSSSFRHFCGGSLIKKNWVLTAGHCVDNWSNQNKIVIGLHNRMDHSEAEVFTSVQMIRHPGYTTENPKEVPDMDYALIQLSGDSSYTPIALNDIEVAIPEATSQEKINVNVTGWGATGEGFFAPAAKILKKVEVPLVTKETCNSAEAYDGAITDNMMCAGFTEGKKDSCQGDSGGPMFTKETDGSFKLIGVVSWGDGCARPNKYGVYSKVNTVIDWISEQTR